MTFSMNLPMSSIIDSACYKNTSHRRGYRADFIFYQLGKFFWLPFCAAGVWFAQTGYERYGGLIDCAIRRRCGLPCPGCGGTRAFYYLFQGSFLMSLQLNPAVIFGVLCYFHFMALYFFRKHISWKTAEKEIPIQNYLYLAIVLILLQWGIKIARILMVVFNQ